MVFLMVGSLFINNFEIVLFSMGKYIIKVILFLLLLYIVDQSVGYCIRYLYFNQEKGRYYRLNYIINKTESEVLVLGSSHATNHFIPEIIENRTGVSCWNAGSQGQGILFVTILLNLIVERYKPKFIIFNIDKDYLVENNSYYDRLSELHPFYRGHNNSFNVLFSKNKADKLKIVSGLYPFNSKIINLLYYSFVSQNDYKGYRPLTNEIEITKERISELKKNTIIDSIHADVDIDYLNAFNEIVRVCNLNNIKLVLVSSPEFIPIDCYKTNYYSDLMTSVKESKCTFWDFSKDTSFWYNRELFNDGTHLNDKGAKVFSNKISDSLIKLY